MRAKSRDRDMWKAIPWKRRAEIAEQVKKMPDGIRKQVLTMAFIENMSTADIARYAEQNDCMHTRNHRPISIRRIQQIIEEEVPDYNAYQSHKQQNSARKDHGRWSWSHKKERCASCGGTESLEWHHMIPAFLGGKADELNMICLCKSCHKSVTEYHKKLYPDHFKNKSARKI